MIGYLSGPITGHKNYRRQFAEAAAALKELGYEGIMQIDLALLSAADYLVQLPGWENSRGANRELGFALGADKIVVTLEDLLAKEVTLPWN